MIKINDLPIDKNLLAGARFASSANWYEYENEKKNEKASGIKIEVLVPKLNLEKIWVKIPNHFDLLDTKIMTPISFTDIEISVYQNYQNKQIGLNCKAKGFKL